MNDERTPMSGRARTSGNNGTGSADPLPTKQPLAMETSRTKHLMSALKRISEECPPHVPNDSNLGGNKDDIAFERENRALSLVGDIARNTLVMIANDNARGPVTLFPTTDEHYSFPYGSPGSELRDYFAGQVMAKLMPDTVSPISYDLHIKNAAAWSYKMADAMIKARER